MLAQTNLPLVSLIVISYNEIDSIAECLNALFKQTYPNFEVIVYDNCSLDGTPDYIAKYFSQVRLMRGSENLGFGGANNKAAKMALGKYIGFVNDDAYVSPGWLEPLVEILKNDKTVGCAGAQLICAENRDVILCQGNDIHLSGIAYEKNRGQVVKPGLPLEVGSISGAAFLVNRDLFMMMGGFESLFFLYYEDIDFSIRIRLQGKRCVVIPGARVFHNCESRFGVQKLFFLERNRYLSLFSLMSVSMLFFMFPSILMFEFFAWGYSLLRGKDAVISKWNAWKAIYEHRNWIKERRHKYAQSEGSMSHIMGAFTPYIHIDYVHEYKFFSYVLFIIGYLISFPSFLVQRVLNSILNLR